MSRFRINLYSSGEDGHRAAYLAYLRKILPSRRVSLRATYFCAEPVLFCQVEDAYFHYFVASICRALLGRLTAGLLFRPLPAVEGRSLRLRIKRATLYVLRKIPHVTTLTILPTWVHPSFSKIVDGWIYDFQFWDLSSGDRAKFDAIRSGQLQSFIARKVRGDANGRTVITAVGRQDQPKGFDVFVESFLSLQGAPAQFHFAFGGKAHESVSRHAKRFMIAGGTAFNGYLSDEDLVHLYAGSDMIWCWYPTYRDQSSGVFGRAIQLGLPVIVRRNSLLHQFAIRENISHFAINDAREFSLVSAKNIGLNPADGKALSEKYKRRSMRVLCQSFRLE